MTDGLTKLKEKFPQFVVRNRTDMARELPIAGGEVVQVGPNGFATIDSEDVIQLPDIRLFELRTPTMDDLVEAGLIQRKETRKAAKPDDTDPTT